MLSRLFAFGLNANTVVWTLTLTESGFMSSAVCAVRHYGCTLYHTCSLTHPSSFLTEINLTPTTMSSNKSSSTTLSVSDIPRFNGRNFQGWSEKMMGVFMMAKVYNVITGDITKPNKDTRPSAPAKPIVITNQTSTVDIPKLQALWTQYQVEMMGYSHLIGEYNRKLSNWTDANSQAMGILNRALDIGIWDQIKDKTAKESWEWLKTKYAKQSHLEVLEHFRFMKDQKFDLSDPNPQIATFMHHFQALPDKFVSPAMACLILLSNLPLTTNPGQESVYQRMLETIFAGWTPESLTPDEVTTQIRDVWGACFGGFHPSQQPHRAATYDKGKAPANKPQQKQQMQVQRNTAIKGKGPNPQYSEQQSADSGSSQQKKKQPF